MGRAARPVLSAEDDERRGMGPGRTWGCEAERRCGAEMRCGRLRHSVRGGERRWRRRAGIQRPAGVCRVRATFSTVFLRVFKTCVRLMLCVKVRCE